MSEISHGGEEARAKLKSVDTWSKTEIERVARGLGRSQIIGRHQDGLPITERELEIQALMERNQRIAKSEKE